MSQFAIVYMVKPTLHVNNSFRDQVETFLKEAFHSSTHSSIKHVKKNNNMCVIALVIFYETRATNLMKVFRVLSCVVYYVIENYFFIDYIGCQSKKLSIICSDKIFKDRSINNCLVLVFQKC